MKFSSRDDVNVPIEQVFEKMTDFASWERIALRRGVQVTRTDSFEDVGPGMAWKVKFRYRGKQRKLVAQMVRYEVPSEVGFAGHLGGLGMNFTLDLIALSPRRTRISTALDLRPETLTARLFLQSLRLARSRLKAGYKSRTEKYAKSMEENFRPVS